MEITRLQLDEWEKYQIGKFCQFHPKSLIKAGKYGNWCGNKTNLGTWCDGGWPTQDFINNLRRGI